MTGCINEIEPFCGPCEAGDEMWYARSPMAQNRVQVIGLIVAFALVGVGCGEAPPNVVDSGRLATVFGDAGRVDAGVVTAPDAGFKWVDTGGYDAGWIYMNGDGGISGGADGGCQLTMCFTGAVSRGGSNAPFDEICDNPAIPGVIRSCDSLNCFNTFNTFGISVSTLYSKLFAALDSNADNKVNGQDRGCKANLLGYSWGGVAAVEVASELASDSRVEAQYKRVTRVFVMDAYQPFKTLTVPNNVERFIEYRHSISPLNDCSRGVIGGPYEGIRPKCYPNQSCFDYDYSQSPNTPYPSSSGASYLGSQIGHCEVPAVAAPAIIADFKGMPYAFMPTQVPVSSP